MRIKRSFNSLLGILSSVLLLNIEIQKAFNSLLGIPLILTGLDIKPKDFQFPSWDSIYYTWTVYATWNFQFPSWDSDERLILHFL